MVFAPKLPGAIALKDKGSGGLPPIPRLGQFTPEFKDQLLIALLRRNGGDVRLDMRQVERDGDMYLIKMRRETENCLALRLEKKQ